MHRQHVLSPPKDKVDLPVLYTLYMEVRFSNSLTSCVIEVLSNFWSNFSYILFYILVLFFKREDSQENTQEKKNYWL